MAEMVEMADLAKTLAATSPVWWRLLKGGAKVLVDAGESILGDEVKKQTRKLLVPVLEWLDKPEAETAFDEAFAEASNAFLARYDPQERDLPREIVSLLSRAVDKELDHASREVLQAYLLTDEPRRAPLDRWVQRQLGGKALLTPEGAVFTQQEVTDALDIFFRELLRALLDQEIFREDMFDVKKIELLSEIRDAVRKTETDLDEMQREYLDYVARQNAWIELRGIAPRVRGSEVKMSMKDLFVPLRATSERDAHMEIGKEVVSRVREALDSGLSAEEALALVESDLPTYVGDLRAELIGGETDRLLSLLRERLQVHALQWGADADQSATIADVLSDDRVVILGDPGTGKTTLLRYAAYAAANRDASLIGEAAVGRVPILARIASFARARRDESKLTLVQYLRDELEKDFSPLLAERLATGDCLVLLDGLDEVAEQHHRTLIAEETEKFIARYPNNQYVVTSRIVGYEQTRLNAQFRHFTLAPLPPDSIADFVTRWYAAIERGSGGVVKSREARDQAEQLTRTIREHPGIQRLATNPLLLTIIALVSWHGGRLPSRRVELYQIACETLIENWPLHQRGIQLDAEQMITILAPVAYHIFATQAGEYIRKRELLPGLVKAVLHECAGSDSKAKTTAKATLDTVSSQSGIFLERGYDEYGDPVYGFLHSSLLEYLAARHLASLWIGDRIHFGRWCHNARWREVVLLAVAHLGMSGRELASRILAQIRDLNSEYDKQLHRDLLLSAAVLADDARVTPKLAADLVQELVALWTSTRIGSLRDDVRELLIGMRTTIHRRHVELALSQLLSDQDAMVRYGGAILLVELGVRESATVRALRERLADDDPHLRRLAGAALARAPLLGVGAVSDLLALLLDEDDQAGWGASESLVQVARTHPEAISDLRDLLDDQNPKVREAAARALGGTKSAAPENVAALLPRLQDSHVSVRGAALSALAALGDRDSATVSSVRGGLLDEDPSVRSRAIWALRDLRACDPETISALRERMGDENSHIREATGRVLKEIYERKPQVATQLRAALSSEDAYHRFTGARALGEAGASDVETIHALRERLADENAHVRYRAVRALMNIQAHDPSTVGAFSDAASDADAAVRHWALKALGSAHARDAGALRAVSQGLTDPDVHVRRAAAEAVAETGTAHVEAIRHLRDCLSDQDDTLAATAAQALVVAARVQGPALNCVTECLRTGEPEVRHRILTALGPAGPRPRALVDALTDCLAHDAPIIRRLAAGALGRRDAVDPEIVSRLRPLLDDAEPEVRLAAVNALMLTGASDATTIRALRGRVVDPDADVRREAVTLLGMRRVAGASTISALLQRLSDPNASVRRAAATALSLLGASDPSTLAALRQLVSDHDAHVRLAGVSALGQLGITDRESLTTLCGLVSDDDHNVRSSTASYLGAAESFLEEACAALNTFLADQNPDVRYSAAWALGRLGAIDHETLRSLTLLLHDTSMAWPSKRPVCESAYRTILRLAEQGAEEPPLLDM